MDKLDHIMSELVKLNVAAAEIRVDLNYHIKRTDKLEELVTREIVPLRTHVDHVNFLGRIAKWAIGSGGVLAAIELARLFFK